MIFACRYESFALESLCGNLLLDRFRQRAEHLVVERLAKPQVVDVVRGVDELVVLRELLVKQVDVEVAGNLVD